MTTPSTANIVLYTDGSAVSVKGGGPGGWGCVVVIRGAPPKLIELSGEEAVTFSNRMEIMAAVGGLEHLVKLGITGTSLAVITDSRMLAHCASGLARMRSDLDLWTRLRLAAAVQRHVAWTWVRGHSNIKGNILADRLAGRAMARAARKAERNGPVPF